MHGSLERRGLLGGSAAALATLGVRPVATEAKKKRKRRKHTGGCEGCFRRLGSGEEVLFAVEGGQEDEAISLCPEGTRAVSGTFFLGNTACVLTEFTASDDRFTGWKASVRCPNGEDSDANAVIAICIS